MPLAWDERKRQSNIRKHGIDFADLDAFFRGGLLEKDSKLYEIGAGTLEIRRWLIAAGCSTRRGRSC